MFQALIFVWAFEEIPSCDNLRKLLKIEITFFGMGQWKIVKNRMVVENS